MRRENVISMLIVMIGIGTIFAGRIARVIHVIATSTDAFARGATSVCCAFKTIRCTPTGAGKNNA
jgi:hypothetical protein